MARVALWQADHADEQGTITAATDSSGTVVERYRYSDYGSVTILAPDGVTVRTTSVIANRHLYTGRLWLSEIGLYEYRHRYYDPSLGRFISRDPAGYAFGLNLYAYLNGDPTAFVDPFGLCPVEPDEQCVPSLAQAITMGGFKRSFRARVRRRWMRTEGTPAEFAARRRS